MSYIEKEKLIKADLASIENRVRHAFNQGYDLGFKDGKKRANPLEQETQSFKWCDTCREYDQEKHCCHRFSKVIRDTVEEMKQEPRWIPVSERLPEPNANDGLTARHYLIQNEYEDMLVARYDGMGWEQMYQHEYLEDDVTAWMPLPAPFEPQESEDKE